MSADPSDPRAWLVRARSNLLLAQKGKRKGVMLEDLAFNAQQSAEKALKAVCLYKEIEEITFKEYQESLAIARVLDVALSKQALGRFVKL